ncbi:unnamed protein product [Penicillium viridicatum]
MPHQSVSKRPSRARYGLYREDEIITTSEHFTKMNRNCQKDLALAYYTPKHRLPCYDKIEFDSQGLLICPPSDHCLSDALIFLLVGRNTVVARNRHGKWPADFNWDGDIYPNHWPIGAFWIWDTFRLRNRALQAVQEASREGDMASRREASRPRSSSVGSRRRSISDSLKMVPWLSPETALSEAATTAASSAPGHTTIYKGIDQARGTGLFDDNGNVNFGCLVYPSRCDFSARQADLYFALDQDVAENYAYYIKRRKWKSLVFHCRKGEKLPSELRKYKLAKLVIGTICGKPNVIGKMRSPDKIREQMVLKTRDGRNAVQYVFKGDDGDTLLEVQQCNCVPFDITTA